MFNFHLSNPIPRGIHLLCILLRELYTQYTLWEDLENWHSAGSLGWPFPGFEDLDKMKVLSMG